jgi:uncharacterized protein YbaR (Trm112 family)
VAASSPATRSLKSPFMDSKLLDLLVCPVTKAALTYRRDLQELQSRSARLAYPIRDGIPLLLESEARALSDEEVAQLPLPAPAL